MKTKATKEKVGGRAILTGMLIGAVSGVLSFEIFSAVMFALLFVSSNFLRDSLWVGAIFGAIIGWVVTARRMTLLRAVFWGGIIAGTPLMAGPISMLFIGGESLRSTLTQLVFGVGSGALCGFGVVWLEANFLPWFAGLSAPPPPLPLTSETEEQPFRV